MVAALAAAAAPAEEARPKLPEEILSLVGLAGASPPELAADALLRAAESRLVPEPALKRQLIEDAFRLSGSAVNRMLRRPMPRLSPDTRTGSAGRAARLKLDALSLQCRAVRAMLAVDKARARELFSELPPPAPPPLTCEDSLIWDPSDYYATLAQVAGQTFSPAERRKQQHLVFFRRRISGLVSPSQVPAVAREIAGLKLAAGERDLLAAGLASALDTIAPDPRSHLFHAEDAEREIEKLAASLAVESPAVSEVVKAAFRKYAAGQLSAGQCAEADVLDIGALLRRRAGEQAGAAAPSREAKLHHYWTSPQAKALAERALKLRWGPQGTPERMLAEDERRKPEWQSQLAEVLNLMDSWRAAPEETEPDFYHQRAILYQALIDVTPPGQTHDNLVRNFVSFVANSNLQREAPVEWLYHTLDLLDRLQSPGGREVLLGELAGSGNPALALVAGLERVLPPPRLGPPVER